VRYHYRCTHKDCRKRFTLRKPVEQYVHRRFKVCPGCGRWIRGQLDNANIHRDNQKRRCWCDAQPHVHKRGEYRCNHYAGTRDDEWHEAVRASVE
jgi:hypothetical protein